MFTLTFWCLYQSALMPGTSCLLLEAILNEAFHGSIIPV